MKEPKVRTGFVIINPYYKEELILDNGHRKTAFKWIKSHHLMDVFKSVVGKNNIYDEEDFLVEYIGSIKLYVNAGQFYCRVPMIFNDETNYLIKYYLNLGYKIISNGIYNEEKQKTKVLTYEYNKTVIKSNNELIYNPMRDGD